MDIKQFMNINFTEGVLMKKFKTLKRSDFYKGVSKSYRYINYCEL